METSISTLRQIVPRFAALSFLLAAASINLLAQDSAAPSKPTPAAADYITALHTPTGFDVNGASITTSPTTTYHIVNGKGAIDGAIGPSDLRIGAYVEVMGATQPGAIAADSVHVLEDHDKKLEGFGVIDKVIAPGSEPVFRADGYSIRIASDAQIKFSGGLKSLADVDTGTWISYEGKRVQGGDLRASRAEFIKARQRKAEPLQANSLPTQPSLIDATGRVVSVHTKVRLSDTQGGCGWHKITMDPALQDRVRRVGVKLIPTYQKQLANDQSSKIQFRFYVVDEPHYREDLECSAGLILVPAQIVARLRNEDQLAAVLANGVAFSLMIQAETAKTDGALKKTAEVAKYTSMFADPGGYLLIDSTVGAVISHERAIKLREQAGRISLALMADAGYDPWQAPEAWRLLAPKEPSSDPARLKYPDRSGYQLGILNLQYGAMRADTAPPANQSAQ